MVLSKLSRVAALIEARRRNGLLLLGVTVFLLWAWLSGHVGRCVAPRYVWLTPFGAVFVAAMGVAAMLRPAASEGHDHGGHGAHSHDSDAVDVDATCCHDSDCHHLAPFGRRAWLTRTIVALPFVLTLAVRPQRLSQEGMRKRRIPGGKSAVQMRRERSAAVDAAIDWVYGRRPSASGPDVSGTQGGSVSAGEGRLELADATLRDVLNWAQQGYERELAGQYVSLVGQAEPVQGEAGVEFDLQRVVVICCIADATTVVLRVVPFPGTSVKPGQWVRVGGLVRFRGIEGASEPVLEASAPVETVPEPDYPYL